MGAGGVGSELGAATVSTTGLAGVTAVVADGVLGGGVITATTAAGSGGASATIPPEGAKGVAGPGSLEPVEEPVEDEVVAAKASVMATKAGDGGGTPWDAAAV